MENRINWVDALKGIGIIFVILGHLINSQGFQYNLKGTISLFSTFNLINVKGFLFPYIYSFHMPLFFFISGYLFSIKKNPQTLPYIAKKIKTLLVPYFFLAIIGVIIKFIITELPITIKAYIYQFLLPVGRFEFFGPLWFLVALFFADILFYFIVKFVRNPLLITLVSVIIGGIGYHFWGAPLKLELNESFYYIAFIGIGFFFNQYKVVNKNTKFIFVTLLSILINLLFLTKRNIFYNIFNHLSHIEGCAFLFEVFIALTGIISYTAIAKLMGNSKTLNYLGKNSLIIFGLHMSIAKPLITYLFSTFNIKYQVNNISGFVITLMILLVMYPICNIINNYFPFIIGKFKLKFNFIKPIYNSNNEHN